MFNTHILKFLTCDSFRSDGSHLLLSIYLSVCMSVCLPVRLSVRPSVHPSIHPSIHPPIHLSISNAHVVYNIIIHVDIDECRIENGGCQYTCENSYGGFVCRCPEDLRIGSDNKTCVRKQHPNARIH